MMTYRKIMLMMFIYAGLVSITWISTGWLSSAQAITDTARPIPNQPTTIQAQVILTPTQDNTIYESPTGALSNGSGEHFFAGKNGSSVIQRGLLAFDLTGQIPAGVTIVSTTLKLHMSKTPSGAKSISLHKIAADWGEGTSIATGGQGGEGGGGTSTSNDATWIHTFFDTDTWDTPGGDFIQTATATTTVAGPAVYIWGSNAGMVADVQSWLDSPATNFGWMLRGNEEQNRSSKRFDSKENGNPANHPQLTIVYELAQTEHLLYLPIVTSETLQP